MNMGRTVFKVNHTDDNIVPVDYVFVNPFHVKRDVQGYFYEFDFQGHSVVHHVLGEYYFSYVRDLIPFDYVEFFNAL